MKVKLKRIEWLNVFAKGFVVESINNNYKNENITIKKNNKISFSNNRNTNIIDTENNNTSFEKLNLSQSKKLVTFKDDNSLFIDLKELFPNSKEIINNIKEEKTIQVTQPITQKNSEMKKKKILRKNNSTKNINCINIGKNKLLKSVKFKKENKNKKKEIKSAITSPLINYINTQKNKLNKILKTKKENNKKTNNENKSKKSEKDSEENKKIKLNNINLNFNLNFHQYINFNKRFEKRKKNTKNQYVFYDETRNVEFGDYTFDDEFLMNENKNTNTNFNFSDLYDTSTTKINKELTGNKNK